MCIRDRTSTLVTDPLTAGLAVDGVLGGDALKNILDVWPGLLVTTWHDGWTVTGTLFTTRDTATDEADTLLGKVLAATVGVWVVGVTTVNDDITLLKTTLGEEQLDEVVDWLTSHDEKHHPSWLLELGAELLDGVSTNDGLALGLVLQEAVDLGDGTVEGDDGEAVVSSVEDQVLTHDGQTDETEVSAVTLSAGRKSTNMRVNDGMETAVYDVGSQNIVKSMTFGGWSCGGLQSGGGAWRGRLIRNLHSFLGAHICGNCSLNVIVDGRKSRQDGGGL